MKIDWSMRAEHLAMAEAQLGVLFKSQPTYWLSIVGGEGELLFVMVYNNFTTRDCEISCASFGSRPFTRKVIHDLFAYPFYQLSLARVSAKISKSNHRALAQISRFGFVEEGLLRDWFPEGDGIMFGMLKEECKWLKQK